jgi:hypothetical protein
MQLGSDLSIDEEMHMGSKKQSIELYDLSKVHDAQSLAAVSSSDEEKSFMQPFIELDN